MVNSYQRNCEFFNSLKKGLSYVSKFEACTLYNYQLEQQATSVMNIAPSIFNFSLFYLQLLFLNFLIIIF